MDVIYQLHSCDDERDNIDEIITTSRSLRVSEQILGRLGFLPTSYYEARCADLCDLPATFRAKSLIDYDDGGGVVLIMQCTVPHDKTDFDVLYRIARPSKEWRDAVKAFCEDADAEVRAHDMRPRFKNKAHRRFESDRIHTLRRNAAHFANYLTRVEHMHERSDAGVAAYLRDFLKGWHTTSSSYDDAQDGMEDRVPSKRAKSVHSPRSEDVEYDDAGVAEYEVAKDETYEDAGVVKDGLAVIIGDGDGAEVQADPSNKATSTWLERQQVAAAAAAKDKPAPFEPHADGASAASARLLSVAYKN